MPLVFRRDASGRDDLTYNYGSHEPKPEWQ